MFTHSETEVKSVSVPKSSKKLSDVIRDQKNLFQLPYQEFIDLIKACIPEVSYLNMPAKVSAEVAKTPGVIFFGMEEPEAIRGFAGLLCFRDVMNGTEEDYQNFIQCQVKFAKPKLTIESFKKLKKYIETTFKTPEDIAALMWSILCNDLGKVIVLQELHYGCKLKDAKEEISHDAVLVNLMLDKEKSKSFSGFKDLSEEHQKIIINGYNSGCDISQFEQLELASSALARLQPLSEKELDFYVAHTFFDVAGAAKPFTESKGVKGYLPMHEETFRFFDKVRELIKKMKEEKLSPDQAYLEYAVYRGKEIGIDYAGSPEQMAFCRIAGLTRFATPEQGKILTAAWSEIKPAERIILTDELNVHGTKDKRAIFIGYGVAMFVNALGKMVGLLKEKNSSPSPEQIANAQKEALKVVFTLLAEIYQTFRKNAGDKPNPEHFVVECDELATLMQKQDPRTIGWKIKPKTGVDKRVDADRRVDLLAITLPVPALHAAPASPKASLAASHFTLHAAPKPLLPTATAPGAAPAQAPAYR